MVNVALSSSYSGNTLKFFLDNSSLPFAQLVIPATGGWESYKWYETDLLDNAIMGKHTVIVRYTATGHGNLKDFKMIPIDLSEGNTAPDSVKAAGLSDEFEVLHALDIISWDGESAFDTTNPLTAEQFVQAAWMPEGSTMEKDKTDLLAACGISAADKITAEKACEVLIRLLKREMTVSAGTTFYQACSSVEIKTGGALAEDNITWLNAIRMLYDATEVAPAVFTGGESSASGTTAILGVRNNDTLLIQGRDIHKGEGVVTMDGITGLDVVSDINENEVLIDNYIFTVGDCDVTGLLGYDVEYYYHAGDYENTLLYIKKSRRNSSVEVMAKDVGGYTDNTLTYYVDGRNKIAKIPDTAKIIYNGLAVSKYNEDMFSMYSGSVELISNDNDNTADVVKLWNTTDYLAQGAYNDILYIKSKELASINLNTTDIKVVITNMVGGAMEPSKIAEDSVLTIAEVEAIDGSYILYTVTVTTRTVSGVVKNIDTDDLTAKIGDTDVALSKKFVEDGLAVGLSGREIKAYLNKYGELAFIESDSVEDEVGFLVKTYYDDSEENILVRIFNEDGEMVTYPCDEKIKIDGSKPEIDAYETLKDRNELIIYSLNGRGNIKKINFAIDESSKNADNGLYHYYDTASVQYKSGPRSLGGKGILSSDFILFKIPTNLNDKENYIVTTETFVDDSSVTLRCYNREQDRLDISIGVQSYDPSTPYVNNGKDVYYVTGKKQGLNAEDEVVYIIEYYTGTSQKLVEGTVSPQNSAAAEALEIGDAIRFTTDSNGEIIGLNRLFSPEDQTLFYTTTSFGAQSRFAKGNVYRKQDAMLQLTAGGEVLNCSSSVVYILEDNEVRIGNINDIYDADVNGTGSEVYMYLKYADVKSIIIRK